MPVIMIFRVCFVFLLTVWSVHAYTLGSPKGPASCLRVGTNRILVLIDPSAGPKPEITTVWDWHKDITLPKPVNSSGLYEYPSCKLIYPLSGWSKYEMPHVAGLGRFLLRSPPRSGGLALYDEGRLVRTFAPEEIYQKYTDDFVVSTVGPDRDIFDFEFDEDQMAWQITTQHRGPDLPGNWRLRWYWESYTWDARTGEVLSSWRIDWILWASWGVMAVLAGIVLALRLRRRKWLGRVTAV